MTDVVTLSKAPSLLGAYGKAAVAAVPMAGKIPGIPGGGGRIPTAVRRLEGVRLGASQLAELRKVTEDTTAGLPLFAPHLLAFPLHMAGMTDGAFPYPAIGTVHLDNVVERREAIAEDALLDLEVRFVGPFAHRKGATFQIETEAFVSGKLVWREVSTMLRVGARTKNEEEAELPALPEGDEPGAGAAQTEWKLAPTLGRSYAAVSGDRNPIHMSDLTAKPFGFPKAIIHGMWTAARLGAAFGDALPEAVSLAVRFERPILLPATVQLLRWQAAANTDLLVRSSSGEKVHARARLTPLAG
ncbi:MAG: MaoC/PaaZ C-terminal domain-containing protein [Solirubrobacteraceae bacterium]|nr:MaoC/PaaZ C-terminal domain-containing protein [Solirubrobacteraceae bacterium]